MADHRLGRILPKIRALKVGHDVIVMIHWGGEYSFLPASLSDAAGPPDDRLRGLAHPWPRTSLSAGIEQYRGGRIVYSLGNFIFDEPHKFANRSFIYGAELDGSGLVRRSEIFPVHPRAARSGAGSRSPELRLERLIDNLGAA